MREVITIGMLQTWIAEQKEKTKKYTDKERSTVSYNYYHALDELFGTPEYRCPFCGGYMVQGVTARDPLEPLSSDSNPELYFMTCQDCHVESPYTGSIFFPGKALVLPTVWIDAYIAWYDLCNDPVKYNEWVTRCVLSRPENQELCSRYKQFAEKKVYWESDKNDCEFWGMAYSSSKINTARKEYAAADEALKQVAEEVKQLCEPYYKKIKTDE